MSAESIELACLAAQQGSAQDAARRAEDALAHLHQAIEALGYGEAVAAIREDANAAEVLLARLALAAGDREKAARQRFLTAWEDFKSDGAATAAEGN